MSVASITTCLGTWLGAGLERGLPFFSLPSLDLPLPIHGFGLLLLTGVIIGSAVMRRYAERHAIAADDLRSLTSWVIATGFIGMHVFDVLLYQRGKLAEDPLLLLKFWSGISSWGGFVGGAAGYAWFVGRRRLPWGLYADTTIVGLLPAFTIGRIGCSFVHDHIGRATDFVLGIDYPRDFLLHQGVLGELAAAGPVIRAHNLGLYELLYLLPINAVILGLAFRRRLPAGFLAILTGLLYAPVRFFLEFFRLDLSDPRYAGLTFAQWCSLAAVAVAAAALVRVWRRGSPAPVASEASPPAATSP
jgi:phosphatidylglycerol---prolipoprotein diacylglyceryl transferase